MLDALRHPFGFFWAGRKMMHGKMSWSEIDVFTRLLIEPLRTQLGRDERVGRGHNSAGASKVCGEDVFADAFVPSNKIKDVRNVSAAESVNRLVVIAYHEEVGP